MSTTTFETPPFAFHQPRSPSPPPFSPRSPHSTQPTHTTPPAMDEPEDTDMTTSIVLPAQNHDRQDAALDNEDGSQANSDNTNHSDGSESSHEVNTADPMDTTPDGTPLPDMTESGPPPPVPPPGEQPISQPTTQPAVLEPAIIPGDLPPTIAGPTILHADTVAAAAAAQIEADEAIILIQQISQGAFQEGTQLGEQIEEDSPDEDDGRDSWQEIQEDTSVPDEQEMKEIEATNEHSALDHEYWEKKAFTDLQDPEYRPGPCGRIHWTVDRFNGTKENPNKDPVMFSPKVKIGEFEWQIKLYPKGNDSEYVSVYIECETIADKSKDEKKKSKRGHARSTSNEASDEAEDSNGSDPKNPEPDTNIEYQHTPVPLLNSKQVPRRRGVAAQISVVMYNPAEPRVYYVRTATHRYCSASPDWGWTRYHGPYYEIQHRHRLQRQSILRNDKLAFTGYLRIIEDTTDCLWEHPTRENPWDNLAMTGLRGYSLGGYGSTGNLVSAVSTWMLLKPFRELLYDCSFPSLMNDVAMPSKPLIFAFQKVLYFMRTRQKSATNTIPLEDIGDAFEWYGIDRNLDKMDVIEIWEVFRTKLEDELWDTPFSGRLTELFGPRKNRMTNMPTYKAPVRGSETMQGAVERATNLVEPYQLPLILTIELERQVFDEAGRAWKKVPDQVKLDEKIHIGGHQYTLFGFVVHKEALQSGLYNSILRPNGPESKWFKYKDSRDENHVVCIPKREAVDNHEGTKGGKDSSTAHVAYVVIYVQDRIAEHQFNHDEPNWEVPRELVDEIAKEQPPDKEEMQVPGLEPTHSSMKVENTEEPLTKPEPMEFTLFSSKAFMEHQGPGILNYFDPKWDTSEHVLKITLNSTDTPIEARDKIAALLPGIKVTRQVKFWCLSYADGSSFKPHFHAASNIGISAGILELDLEWNMAKNFERTRERRLWFHVVDEADLTPLPKDLVVEIVPNGQAVPPPPPVALNNGDEQIPTDQDVPPEDTAMSGAEDEITQFTPPPPAPSGGDDDHPPPIPPPLDMEMDDPVAFPIDPQVIPSPPPMDRGLTVPPSPPPPPAPVPTRVEEVYFFLKLFDAEAQTLKPHGSYVAKRNARIDHTVKEILGMPEKQALLIWEEEHVSCARQLRRRKTFNEEDLQNSDIIIAQVPVSDEAKAALTARAGFSDPNTYLHALAEARNFPDLVNGHYTLDYFSSEYFSGSMVARQPHGEGKKIYYNGDIYIGSFQLGQRRGHGVMTFQNGDTYKGNWENGMQHGNGTYVEKETGNTYIGGWKADKRFGEGITHWKVAQETERMCRICWEGNAEAAFYDCGHVVACINCARRVENCPVCRKRVVSAIKLFYAT
ncbi:hypothetical protein EJ08DRAFT_640301 [Tothia fuscella]|uniref:RING-type domain-containing protein n=1 Tax=Tothia fuscella TaxID=1048955 RepID=A0A9P4NJ26_9PEZI|nr:hypothetical protein EJ08DRAFT_640301 [Tothia fuscella]